MLNSVIMFQLVTLYFDDDYDLFSRLDINEPDVGTSQNYLLKLNNGSLLGIMLLI